MDWNLSNNFQADSTFWLLIARGVQNWWKLCFTFANSFCVWLFISWHFFFSPLNLHILSRIPFSWVNTWTLWKETRTRVHQVFLPVFIWSWKIKKTGKKGCYQQVTRKQRGRDGSRLESTSRGSFTLDKWTLNSLFGKCFTFASTPPKYIGHWWCTDVTSSHLKEKYIYFSYLSFILSKMLRNIYEHSSLEIKKHWARDDPAFAAILCYFIIISSFSFSVAFSAESLLNVVRFIFLGVIIDFFGVGIGIATLGWFVFLILSHLQLLDVWKKGGLRTNIWGWKALYITLNRV